MTTYTFERAITMLTVAVTLDIKPSVIINAAKYIVEEYKNQRIPKWVKTIAEVDEAEWHKVKQDVIEQMSNE